MTHLSRLAAPLRGLSAMRAAATISLIIAIVLLHATRWVYAQGGPYVLGQCYIVLNNGTQVHVRAGDSNEALCFQLKDTCTLPGTSGQIHYNSSPIYIEAPYQECNAIRPSTSSNAGAGNNYPWSLAGVGDCGGHDIACSPGATPQPSKCSGGDVVAVCWNGARNPYYPPGMNCGGDPAHWCTYKKGVGQCSGGSNPGIRYYCTSN
jgi:hypothetical protein